MTLRWCPPLPTVGRVGPRIDVLPGSTILQRLEDYYCEIRSVPDIFERRVPPFFQKKALRCRYAPTYLSEMTPGEQTSCLLRNLYFKVSSALRGKLKKRLYEGGLHQVRAWFQTADAVVLPLLISEEYHSARLEADIDVLTNWALENCAHHYAQFQRDLKSLKKQMRKSFALHNDIEHVDCPGYMNTYYRAAKSSMKRTEFSGPADIGRWVLLWCQTRATGLADQQMIRESFTKFEATVTEPGCSVTLDPSVLQKVCRAAIGTNGTSAKVSVGTTACLESTRANGGKTSFVSHLARHKVLRRTYNFRSLEREEIEPRAIRSAEDLVHWSIDQLLEKPTYTSLIRVHAVAEPSKARTITVAPYAYQVIMGVFAHLFQPSLVAKQVRSGLKADRHLWRFLTDTLNPQNKDWGELIDDNVYSLSTDLSEATDWGNRRVASQIWQQLIEAANGPGFPLGLAVLAKTKYCGKRFALIPDESHQNFRLITLQRGWMMGDMMTKVILTLAHQYCCELSRLKVYTLVGDDEIALSSDRNQLENHLVNLNKIFKVSELDTFISSTFAFYCEEGTLVPQRVQDVPHVRMRRGQELQYLDYPRIRLLLPQPSEVDAYSMNNIGRFALLGKECRWVASSNSQASRMFSQASLLQHLLVPQEPDCICPYTPIEIGGDGAFPHSESFMRRVVSDKSRNPRETTWRLHSLINQRFGYKFVRSDRLDKVVNKHHLYLPKIEKLRELLPENSILEMKDPNQKAILTSLRHPDIASPQDVFFQLAKGIYYKYLLTGRDPVEPVFNIERSFEGGHTHDPTLDFNMFIETWKNPGFKFQDEWGYMVDMRYVHPLNPMNLGWDWNEWVRTKQSYKTLYAAWYHENVDYKTQSLPDMIELVRNRKPLPEWAVQRLNLLIESDTYIMQVLPREWANHPEVALITRDQRLCLLVQRKLDAWNASIPHRVYCVDPVIYLTGRLEETPVTDEVPHLQDPGAMLHVDYLEFDDGFCKREDVWDLEVKVKTTQRGCVLVVLDGYYRG